MKHLISLLFALTLTVGLTNAQSSIVSLTVSPVNPNVNDTIYVSADLQFPSSGCVLDIKAHSLIGNTISASTMHCLGGLTAICNITDTFKINPLPAGTYTFNLTLSSGYGGPPCSPGIVPDDNDTVSFFVSYSVDNKEIQKQSIEVFPNPANQLLNIRQHLESNHNKITSIKLTDLLGKEYYLNNKETLFNSKLITLNVETLPNGIYILEIEGEQKFQYFKLMIQH